MKPNYYTTHMIASIRQACKTGSPGMRQSATAMNQVCNMFQKATKFLCPENGLFFEDGDMGRYVEFVRLPMPTIALEYSGTTGSYFGAKGGDPVMICVLAVEYVPPHIQAANDPQALQSAIEKVKADPVEADKQSTGIWEYTQPVDLHNQPLAPDIEKRLFNDQPGCIVYAAYGINAKQWCIVPMAIFIPYGMTLDSLRGLNDKAARSFVFAPACAKEFPQSTTDMGLSLLRESLGLMQFCAAIACNNVVSESVPAPKFINRKRAEKGQPPLFEYRILTVDVRPHNEAGVPQGGHHAPPRQHIRRGHIRRYRNPDNSVRFVRWIQAMVVGNAERGKVVKDYQVRT